MTLKRKIDTIMRNSERILSFPSPLPRIPQHGNELYIVDAPWPYDTCLSVDIPINVFFTFPRHRHAIHNSTFY